MTLCLSLSHKPIHHKGQTLLYASFKKINQDLGEIQDEKQTAKMNLTVLQIKKNITIQKLGDKKAADLSDFVKQYFDWRVSGQRQKEWYRSNTLSLVNSFFTSNPKPMVYLGSKIIKYIVSYEIHFSHCQKEVTNKQR